MPPAGSDAVPGAQTMSGAIRRIRVVNYRCLRNVDVELDQFHVLVGANGSGKSALFDVLLFVRELMVVGLDDTVERRTNNFRDLVWGRPDRDLAFEFSFEMDVPGRLREQIPRSYDRFTVSLHVHEGSDGELSATLKANLKLGDEQKEPTRSDFAPVNWTVERKLDSESLFRQAAAFEHPLIAHFVTDTVSWISELALESRRLRQASRAPRFARPTPSSSLPSVVLRLKRDPDRYDAWLQHIRTAISDIRDIRVTTRDDDRHSYLSAVFSNGLEVPSWGLSDGTLRLLALTIIAYLPKYRRTYLIEEPENGIHPLAVEAAYRSLSSSHRSQVLVTTHSPVLLACTEPKELLCFSKRGGETQIVRGDKHPELSHWQSAADVDLLFASEVLG